MKAHIPAKAALSKKSKQAVREYVDSYEKRLYAPVFETLLCSAAHGRERPLRRGEACEVSETDHRAGTEQRRNLLASC